MARIRPRKSPPRNSIHLLRGYSFFGILLSISVIRVIRGSNGIIYAETPGGQRVLRLAGLGINFPTLKMLAFIAATFAAISPLEAQIGRWEFDFAASDHGFLAGFADYPSRDFDPALYDFVADRRARRPISAAHPPFSSAAAIAATICSCSGRSASPDCLRRLPCG